ncbi:MAG TPA: NAD(P)/FAD-dependent oxidoreductase [Abditibacteriaceae bacterium]|jgi:flavin-dependent dehydrogenase
MSTQHVDVAVIGAGLGGAVAAITLAQRGARVALFEAAKMPRHKVCGEFLSPEIKQIFARIHVLDSIEHTGACRIESARIVSGHRVLETTLPGAALAISRYRLDELLWEAAQSAGAQCFDEARVRSIEGNVRDGFLVSTQGEQWHARFVVAAAGRNARVLNTGNDATSSPARFVGFKTHFGNAALEPGAVELHPFRGGYCGLVRIEDGLTNACLLADYNVVAGRSPAAFWQWLLGECPALRRRVGDAQTTMPWLSTANITFGGTQPVQDGVLRCGDAAGFIHPLTGDGMAMAARSGELAAVIIVAALKHGLKKNDISALYTAAWRREFAARLRWATRLQPLLTSPHGCALAVGVLKHTPGLARRAVALTRG